MKNKFLIMLIIVALVVVGVCTFTACSNNADYETNLLTNSNFESKNDSGSISDWVASDTSAVTFKSNDRDDEDYDVKLGSYYAYFNVSSSNYVYIAQNLTLEKNAFYRITAYVRVDSVVETSGVGLRFGFESDNYFSGFNIVDATNEEWEQVEYYFTSGTKEEVKFTIGVGSNKTNTTATAYVDNVVLEKVEEIPSAYTSANTIEVLRTKVDSSLLDGGAVTFVVLIALLSIVLACAIYLGIKKGSVTDSAIDPSVLAKDETPKTRSPFMEKVNKYVDTDKLCKNLTSNFALFLYVMIGALLVRFLFVICSFGMSNNVNELEYIGRFVNNSGLLSFFSLRQDATYTMGNTILYGAIGKIATLMNIKEFSLGYSILVRMPIVIADLVVVYMIYMFTAKHVGEKSAVMYSSLYAFIPLFFFFGSFYASTQVIAIAFIIAMFIAILNKDYVFSGAWYTLALIFSNYALLLLPIILIFQIYGIVKEEENRATIIVTMVVSFVLFYVLAMLLTWKDVTNGQLFVYFKRMYASFQNSAYLSDNTFSLYGVFGAANYKQRNTLVEVLNWLFVIALSAWPAYLYIKNKNRSDLVINGSLMVVSYAIVSAQCTTEILPIGLAIMILYMVIVPENRLYLCYLLLSAFAFLNIAQLAAISGFISGVDGATLTNFASKDAFLIIFSILTTLTYFYYVYVVVDITYYNQSSEIEPLQGSLKNELKKIVASLIPNKTSSKKRK